MTIQDVIDSVVLLRNEKKATSRFIISNINEIEWRIKREVIDEHEGAQKYPFDGYSSDELNVKLIAPEPYSELYIKWVLYQLDIANKDMESAVNSLSLFKSVYEDFCRWYRRNNMPVHRGNIKSEAYHL